MRLRPLLALLTLSAAACDDPGPASVALPPDAPSALDAATPLLASTDSDTPAAHVLPRAFAAVEGGGTVVLDFEQLGPNLGVGPSYEEDGFELTLSDPPPDDPFGGVPAVFGSASEGHPFYAGSRALFVNDVRPIDAILRRTDGGAFSARSIDLSPVFAAPGRAGPVTFVGYGADGSEVVRTVPHEDVFGFQTFALDGFGAIVELRWGQRFPAQVHQFDNVVLGPADPASKDACMNGGWADYGFRNQGQCVRFVETGKDSR